MRSSRTPQVLLLGRLIALATFCGLPACAITPSRERMHEPETAPLIDEAGSSASLAIARREYARAVGRGGTRGVASWLRCAEAAFVAMHADEDSTAREAAQLSTECTRRYLATATRGTRSWQAGLQTAVGGRISLELRDPSRNLARTFRIVLAEDVPMTMYWGKRNVRPGYGVPVALISPRCDHRRACKLLPVSGVFRSGTAWVEPGQQGAPARLVVAHPDRTGLARSGSRLWPLAMDSSAFYAAGLDRSPVGRMSLWSFFGGKSLGRRAGVYLLDDYDPIKRPVVMVHGLASSPLTWARLSNEIWADPVLRSHYQIWQLVYQTNDPALVARLRVEEQLDDAWSELDPEGDDLARHCMLLVGHSLGGVVARLLTAESGTGIWNAAFTSSRSALAGDPTDLAIVERMYRFKPYPGIERAIFVAAPHRGSPAADSLLGRLANSLTRQSSTEVAALKRVVRRNPGSVPEELRPALQSGRINGIATLRASEPVMKATHKLMPIGIPFHTIAGELTGAQPPGDGIVPLASALLEGAESTLLVSHGHNVHENPEAIAEILRILREAIEHPGASAEGCRRS